MYVCQTHHASTALPNHILLVTYCTRALELTSRLAEEIQPATLAENLTKATPISFSISGLNQLGRGSKWHSAGAAWSWPGMRVQVHETAEAAPLGGGAPFDQLQPDCSDGSSINHQPLRL